MEHSTSIAITGATGLIGSYLLRYLVSEGYTNIRALSRKSSRTELVEPVRKEVEWTIGDILDITLLDEFVRDADIVIHAAAIVSFSRANRTHLMDINVRGTANVINACLANGVSQFVHISSTSALGTVKGNQAVDENTEWKKGKLNTPYAKSKFMAELEAFRGYAEGLDVRVVNPTIVLGSGFWDRSSSNLIPKIAAGIPIYPRGSNGFVDVRDVAQLIEKVCDRGHSGERYISCGGHLPYRKLMQIVSDELGQPPPSYPLRNWMIPLVIFYFRIARLFGSKGSSVTSQSLNIAQAHRRFDNTKSVESLGMNYRPIEQSIRETTQQFKQSMTSERDYAYLPLR